MANKIWRPCLPPSENLRSGAICYVLIFQLMSFDAYFNTILELKMATYFDIKIIIL